MPAKKRIFQLFAVAAIFGGLFVLVDIEQFIAVLRSVDIGYLSLLVLFSVVLIWASCLKWQLFLSHSGSEVSILTLMRLYTIGYFFNSFMPAYVGGDIARSVQLGSLTGKKLDAFVATFLERFTGLLAMTCLGSLFVLYGVEATSGLEFAVIGVTILTLVIALFCFSEKGERLVESFVSRLDQGLRERPLVARGLGLYSRAHTALRQVGDSPKVFFIALLYSFFFHALTVVNTYIACLTVGWTDVSFQALFIVVPLILIIGMVPLTPSGLGVQEGAFMFLLSRIGADVEVALAVGLVLRAKVLLVALTGGLLLVFSNSKKENLVLYDNEQRKVSG